MQPSDQPSTPSDVTSDSLDYVRGSSADVGSSNVDEAEAPVVSEAATNSALGDVVSANAAGVVRNQGLGDSTSHLLTSLLLVWFLFATLPMLATSHLSFISHCSHPIKFISYFYIFTIKS